MRIDKLSRMKLGWFLGNFDPTVYKTDRAEVALKRYRAGEVEKRHHHKIATEITLVVSGEAELNTTLLKTGDIAIVEPGESCTFRALTDVVNVVVKVPSCPGDKYPDPSSPGDPS